MNPENELGVIARFAQEAPAAGFEIISIQPAFPDAVLIKDNKTYRAEFEYLASNFIQHKHDVRKCDLIICWENDVPSMILPVLALSEADWPNTPLQLPSEHERELFYWKRRALSAERQFWKLARGTGGEDTSQRNAFNTSKEEALNALLEYVAANPQVSLAKIGEHIGRAKSTTGLYVEELATAGILNRSENGWQVEGHLP